MFTRPLSGTMSYFGALRVRKSKYWTKDYDDVHVCTCVWLGIVTFFAPSILRPGVPRPAQIASVGTPGLLCFKAPADRGIRYHHDPDKTASAYVAPGVLTLGDIGRVDDDGFVYITDRAADVVVSGGVNLYPAEGEQCLIAHPGVADVAVIGIPHPDLGEQLLALVVSATEVPPSAADLEAWCRRTLAPYKCPRRFEFVDVLPRNAMNKLDKPALRRPYWPSDRTVAG
jgi:long-chain acyl-CoA synthetase